LDQLSAEERARHARFVFAEDRRDFAAAHLLLRRMLSTHGHPDDGQSTFERGPHGKPYLARGAGDRPAPAFNLAHTRGLVAAVVAPNVEVGIDVESLHRDADTIALARRYFSVEELRELEGCRGVDRETRFTELWTLKEAYLKGTGAGIANELRSCTFTLDGPTFLRFEPADRGHAHTWSFALFEVGDHRLAVALRDAAYNRDVLSMCDHGAADSQARPAIRLLRASPDVVLSGCG
jgi:4'-phosphopantetheinyl transferase